MEDRIDELTAGDVDALDVYWRPGCSSCTVLLWTLERVHAVVRLHDISEDDVARAFVRAQNDGEEVVPTVRMGWVVTTNPSPSALVELIAEQFPDLLSDTIS